MARNPSSSDGSAPAIGELVTGTSGSRPRTAHRGERVAQLVTDPTRSPEMDAHNDAARAALAGHNSGASGGDGPVQDPTSVLSGSGSRASRNTWADPSSQG